jgi:hypothetical protein
MLFEAFEGADAADHPHKQSPIPTEDPDDYLMPITERLEKGEGTTSFFKY